MFLVFVFFFVYVESYAAEFNREVDSLSHESAAFVSSLSIIPASNEVDFETTLMTIQSGNKIKSKCFICRVWEDDIHHPNNIFTLKLREDLIKAGIDVRLDQFNLLTGKSIRKYIKQISNPDFFIILLLTPKLKQRVIEKKGWIFDEVILIEQRLRIGNNFYVPLLIEGDPESSIPDTLNPTDLLYKDFRNSAMYHQNFLEILREKLLQPRLLNPNLEDNFDEALSVYESSQLTMYKDDALRGDTFSLYSIILMYEMGYGMRKELARSKLLKWCYIGIEKDFFVAYIKLGEGYLKSDDEEDKKQAVHYFINAVELIEKQQNDYEDGKISNDVNEHDEKNEVESDSDRSNSVSTNDVLMYEKESGDAYKNLGLCYLYGIGIESNMGYAVTLFNKAIEKENDEAKYYLAICYFYGHGVEKDRKMAFQVFKSVCDSDARAYYYLGICYENGYGTKKNPKKTINMWKKGSDEEDDSATVALGNYYENGVVVKQNIKTAITYYRKGIEQGNTQAKIYLAYCFENGVGVERDIVSAARLYKEAIDEGEFLFLKHFQKLYIAPFNTTTDFTFISDQYEILAFAGDCGAQNNLGCCYLDEEGIVENEDNKFMGMYWFLCASQDCATAKYNLGLCFMKGEYIEKDDTMAFHLFLQAANMEHLYARLLVSYCYENGIGGITNLDMARHYYNLAIL